jgi:hypothetical protein
MQLRLQARERKKANSNKLMTVNGGQIAQTLLIPNGKWFAKKLQKHARSKGAKTAHLLRACFCNFCKPILFRYKTTAQAITLNPGKRTFTVWHRYRSQMVFGGYTKKSKVCQFAA